MPRFLLVLLATATVSPAWAGRDKDLDMASTTASRALTRLLDDASWTPTPELSGAFHPGYVYAVTDSGHQLQSRSCIASTPSSDPYTSAEIVRSLSAGVSTPFAGATAGIVKQLKFGAPTHEAIPGLELKLTPACQAELATHDRKELQHWYVVKEVLRAEIAEQTCGRIDATGRFSVLGQADATLQEACSRASLEPIAVGFRTVPLLDLLPATEVVSTPKPAPVPKAAPAPAPTVLAPAPPASPSRASDLLALTDPIERQYGRTRTRGPGYWSGDTKVAFHDVVAFAHDTDDGWRASKRYRTNKVVRVLVPILTTSAFGGTVYVCSQAPGSGSDSAEWTTCAVGLGATSLPFVWGIAGQVGWTQAQKRHREWMLDVVNQSVAGDRSNPDLVREQRAFEAEQGRVWE